MATEVLDVCDRVVAAITEYWEAADPPKGAADRVVRDYAPEFSETPQEGEGFEPPRPAGRRVWVFPDESVHHGEMDREGDDDEHFVVVAIEEWYDGAGTPPRDWLDVRLAFTKSLWKLLRNARPEPEVIAGFRPESAEVQDWYDVPMLRFNRAYLSFVRLSYREIADPNP